MPRRPASRWSASTAPTRRVLRGDVAALAGLQLAAIVLPKATPEAVSALGAEGPPVVAIVETAQGVRLAYEIASTARVVALVLGAADLGAQLWLEPRADGQELLYARSKLVVDSAAAERRGPFDVVHLDVADDDGLEAEALLARTLGLRGKVCIHPRQVAVVNRVFAPSADELEWAHDVLTAYDEAARGGRGALVVRGALVDRALVQRASASSATSTGAPWRLTPRPAPKEWRGRFYEDIDVGDVYAGRLGRTITETDNVWFTCLTMNTNQMHFNVPYAERSRFGKPLVNSGFTIALVTGMSVPDTSENATANLESTDVKLPSPVFVGDTLWVESEILDKRESRSTPSVGIVSMRCRGINQRREVVIEFRRTFMLYKRGAPEVEDSFPGTETHWNV